jgi:hypothetical protein
MLGENQSTCRFVRGTIGETPWGWTLGALGMAERTAQVTLRSGDQVYRITFDRGLVVAASSPAAVDAITRIALTNHFIAKTQVNEIKRCLATAPTLDEIDVLAAAANFTPEQTRALRIRTLTQRAARTFAVDMGDFEIEDCAPAPTAITADIRAVIYMGARQNLREDRLRFGLRQFGSRFVLKPDAAATLDGYNFTREESPLLATLRSPTSFAELEANHREIDPRAVQAVVYALASCSALVELDLSSQPVPAVRRGSESGSGLLEMSVAQGTPQLDAKLDFDEVSQTDGLAFDGPLTKAITSLQREEVEQIERFEDDAPTIARTLSSGVPADDRALLDTFRTSRVTCVRPNALTAHEVVALVKELAAQLARGVDHFTLLGLPVGAPIEDIHAAYVEISRHLNKQRLAELGITDKSFVAAGVLAQVGIAFTVLTDRTRRNEYLATIARAARR